MLEPGTYNARAIEAALGRTAAGKEQIAVEFEVVDPDLAGHRITWFGFFSDLAFERTVQSLRYCGWQGDDLADLKSIHADNGTTVQIVVVHEEYNGRMSAKVNWVNRPGGVALKDRMSDGDAKGFAAKMKARVGGVTVKMGATGAAPRPASPRGAKPPVDDNDSIPF